MLDETSAASALSNLAAPEPNEKGYLRFLTCGSVDDGKSTLIGRLLYESGAIYDDQLQLVESDSKKHGTTGNDIDFALLVDGLEAEREQGITIDVAYRYFSTSKRSFIVADTPGQHRFHLSPLKRIGEIVAIDASDYFVAFGDVVRHDGVVIDVQLRHEDL